MDGKLPQKNKFIWEMKDEEDATNFCYYIYSNYKYRNFIKEKTHLLYNLSVKELQVLSKSYEILETFNDDKMFFQEKVNINSYFDLLRKIPTIMDPINDRIGSLIRIMKNVKHYKLEENVKISGAISINHFSSDFYKKNIYIIGERHINMPYDICENAINNFKYEDEEYIYDPEFKIYLNLTKAVHYWNKNISDIRNNIKIKGFIPEKNYSQTFKLLKKYNEYFFGIKKELHVEDVLDKIMNEYYKYNDKHISYYIKNIINKGDVFVDILFESWYDMEERFISPFEKGDDDDFIKLEIGNSTLLYMNIDECLEKNIENVQIKYKMKNKESCSHYRIDYIDPRNFYNSHFEEYYDKETKSSNIFNNFGALLFLLKKYNKSAKKYDNVTVSLIRYLSSEPLHEIILSFFEKGVLHESIKNYYYTHVYLQKEISKSYISDKINDYFEEKLEEEINKMDDVDMFNKKNDYIEFRNQMLDEIKDEDGENDIEVMDLDFYENMYENYLISLLSLITDTYTLARIFKHMEHEKNEEHGPEEIRNCILAVGDHHAENLEHFFTKNNFEKEVMMVRNSPHACNTIKDVQRWFKKTPS
jgi:hypothetical protein